MSTISSSLSANYLQLISNTLQSAGVTSGAVSQAGQQTDSSQLSPLAQLLNTLQQLQQSDPTKYQQVTAQISSNLQSAAQSAQSAGNTTAASQLNQLATDFSTASKTGQLPNIQDLAQAVGGGHHHHHHGASSSSDSDSSSTSSSTTSTTSSSSNSALQTLTQLLSALQQSGTGSGTQNQSLNPLSIIQNTLSNAGVTTTNS